MRTLMVDSAVHLHQDLGPGLSEMVLRFAGLKLGHLWNFIEGLMTDGITRIVNGEL